MYDTMVNFSLAEHLFGYNFIPPKGRSFYPRQASIYRKLYRNKDGYIRLLPYNDGQ